MIKPEIQSYRFCQSIHSFQNKKIPTQYDWKMKMKMNYT